MNIKNKYSPKENLGLLIIANENVNFKEIDNLILSLEQVLSQNKTKSEILEMCPKLGRGRLKSGIGWLSMDFSKRL